jgi:hypothetical protein
MPVMTQSRTASVGAAGARSTRRKGRARKALAAAFTALAPVGSAALIADEDSDVSLKEGRVPASSQRGAVEGPVIHLRQAERFHHWRGLVAPSSDTAAEFHLAAGAAESFHHWR